MEIVIDAHALFWFLTNSPRLSKKTANLISGADVIVVPTIVLAEILYIFKKNRAASQFSEFLSSIDSTKYLIYPLDIQVLLKTVPLSEKLEMHDAMIVATASIRDAFLISKDGEIKKYYSKTIW